MTDELLVIASSVWLGILTSVSPCPLATNIAATTVLARRLGNRSRALAGLGAYTLGRVGAYALLAAILFLGLASMPALSTFLRQEVLPLVGPVLILAGMVVPGWIPLPFHLRAGSGDMANRFLRGGILGEFTLGGVFALSFCPVSAALFFGSLIPLALTSSWPILAVLLYGIGTALPVGILSFVAIFSLEKAGSVLKQVERLQKAAIFLTAVVLIAIGCWLTLHEPIRLL